MLLDVVLSYLYTYTHLNTHTHTHLVVPVYGAGLLSGKSASDNPTS